MQRLSLCIYRRSDLMLEDCFSQGICGQLWLDLIGQLRQASGQIFKEVSRNHG